MRERSPTASVIPARGLQEKKFRERSMANPRQEAHESAKKTAEEANRAANKMAEAGERTARAGVAAFQRNTETAREAWESGSEAAADWTRRSTEQFARMFGFAGEEVEKAAEQSVRNLRAIAGSSTIFVQCAQQLSQEYLDLLRKSYGRNVEWFNAFARSRSPQELMAAQSDVIRENLQDLLETTKRTAEASVRMADEATERISETVQAASRRAA
jgi:phasin family protein